MKNSMPKLLLLICLFTLFIKVEAQKPQLVVQTGHGEAVQTLAVSPDNKLIASGGIDTKVIIWNSASKRQIYSLTEHKKVVTSVAFSPDGKYLASGSMDGSVKIWDVVRGVKLWEFPEAFNGVACVTFSPDNKTLAVAGGEKFISIWDFSTNQIRKTPPINKRVIDKIAFSQDGKFLLSLAKDLSLISWNLSSPDFKGSKFAQLENRDLNSYLDISPSGKFAAATTSSSKILIWDLQTQKEKVVSLPKEVVASSKGEKKAESPKIDGFVFLSDEELLCIARKQLTIWNFKNNQTTKITDIDSSEDSILTISTDRKLSVFSADEEVSILDIQSKQFTKMVSGFESFYNLSFFPKLPVLVSSAKVPRIFGDFDITDYETAGPIIAKVAGNRTIYIRSIQGIADFGKNKDGSGTPNLEIEYLDGKKKEIIKAHSQPIESITVHPDGIRVATCSEDRTIKIWNAKNWDKPEKIINENVRECLFSPNGKWLAVTYDDVNIKIYNTENWTSKVLFQAEKGRISHLIFSPDKQPILVAQAGLADVGKQFLMVWDIEKNSLLYKIRTNNLPEGIQPEDLVIYPFFKLILYSMLEDYAGSSRVNSPLNISPDGKFIVFQYKDNLNAARYLKIIETATGKEVKQLFGHTGAIRGTAFNGSGKILASSSNDTSIKLWNAHTGEELATIVTLNETDWVIYTPEGRFDTNADLEEKNILHWSIPGAALNPLPLDVFRYDYYEPKLFERIINCTENGNCFCPDNSDCDQQPEFNKIRRLSELNIIRPNVKITNVSLPDANRDVTVNVEVSKASNLIEQQNVQKLKNSTDIYDLRLFMNKQLVADVPFDGAEKIYQRRAELENSEWKTKFEKELKVWRENTKVKLDPQTGKQILSFKVRLPKGQDASDIEFTAYAFNEDRVKSETAKYEWTAAQKVKLPKADNNVKKRAYVISIGVNGSSGDSELIYAANDADKFQDKVFERLNQTGNYEVVPIKLTTTKETGSWVVNATKENIKTVFDLLAGKNVLFESKQKIPNYEKIKKSTPDDLIIISYSGHGDANRNSDFYLKLSNSEGKSSQELTDDNLQITGEELAIWLRNIEMNEMALIIDACKSAAAVENLDFKPGPFGGRGFGQLVYDKRLKVLVAAQADSYAVEDQDEEGEIKGGLLNHALIDQGLINDEADSTKDGKITLDEWLKYGESRIPSLFEKVKNKQETVAKKKGRDSNRPNVSQRATYFNFSQSNRDLLLFLTTKK